ncbi:AMP-binding protein [Nocardioides panacisoli]|uniref:AMP-binding protein n=1 Tax=Nocardioides panacisoli TaxID=627624 RepID=UPI001C632398|nr:AMP-binding protein [Nocardioides panacisoli]QYJ03521.1 AMP-binding protein [Nocardioides panacisoli]
MTTDFDPSRTPILTLAAAAADAPDLPLVSVEGEEATYGEAWRAVRETALGLRRCGVDVGDRVILLIPNRLEAIWAWFGVQAAGAVDAPISVEAPGAFLRYLAEDLSPTAVIGTAPLLAALAEVMPSPPDLAVVVGEAAPEEPPFGTDVRHLGFDELRAIGAASPEQLEPPPASTVGTIMYSSGTTGPSKGVMLSQGYYATLSAVHADVFDLATGATTYCVQPLCHIDGRSSVVNTINVRGRLFLGTRFSASRFWEEVERYDVDYFYYVGTMIHLLHKQPSRAASSPVRHRIGIGSATPASIQREFEARFNCELVQGYGLTEFGLILAQRVGDNAPGHVGRTLPWVEVQVVDADDVTVADGTPGQLICRPLRPHLHMLGYWNKPEATVEAWCGLWFHTGDVVVRHDDGCFEYVGRAKDSIRRRGENVSAWEVEQAASRHECVLEAAAIGVPSDVGEEDVALLVVPSAHGRPEPSELRSFMASDLPRYALPRYVEVVEELPKTPSERIAKGLVRERGLSRAAWDAEETSVKG